MSHGRTVCEHGRLVSQCRCIQHGKTVEVVRPCPFGVQHLGLIVMHPLPPRPGAMAVRSPDCASGFHAQCPQQPGAPAPRCHCRCHQSPEGLIAPAQLPAGAPETPEPVALDPPGASEASDGVGAVTVTLSIEDYRFVTEYDPDRERSASRRELVAVLREIGLMLRENRVDG